LKIIRGNRSNFRKRSTVNGNTQEFRIQPNLMAEISVSRPFSLKGKESKKYERFQTQINQEKRHHERNVTFKYKITHKLKWYYIHSPDELKFMVMLSRSPI
jgi:hypothetical protein